jgi:hypothetical protein
MSKAAEEAKADEEVEAEEERRMPRNDNNIR